MSNGMIHNSIAANTRIVGTITAENDFRVDGVIEGEIICQGKVVIGQTANVKGKLTCSLTLTFIDISITALFIP